MLIQTIDRDDLDRTLDHLCVEHGNLEILPADPSTGSVCIVAQDGAMWRFTTQSRLIPIGRATRRAEGQRS